MRKPSKKRILRQEENQEKKKKTDITFFKPHHDSSLDTEEDYFGNGDMTYEEPSELYKLILLESEIEEEKENVQENMARLLEDVFSESPDKSENDSSILKFR